MIRVVWMAVSVILLKCTIYFWYLPKNNFQFVEWQLNFVFYNQWHIKSLLILFLRMHNIFVAYVMDGVLVLTWRFKKRYYVYTYSFPGNGTHAHTYRVIYCNFCFVPRLTCTFVVVRILILIRIMSYGDDFFFIFSFPDFGFKHYYYYYHRCGRFAGLILGIETFVSKYV